MTTRFQTSCGEESHPRTRCPRRAGRHGEITRLRTRVGVLQAEMFKLIDAARFEETAPVAQEIVTIEGRLATMEQTDEDDQGDGGSAGETDSRSTESHRAMARAGWKRSQERLRTRHAQRGQLTLRRSVRAVSADERERHPSRRRWREKTQVRLPSSVEVASDSEESSESAE